MRKGFKHREKIYMIKLSFCHNRDALVCYFFFFFIQKDLDEVIYKNASHNP